MDRKKAEKRLRLINKLLKMNRLELSGLATLLAIPFIVAVTLSTGTFIIWFVFSAWRKVPFIFAVIY